MHATISILLSVIGLVTAVKDCHPSQYTDGLWQWDNDILPRYSGKEFMDNGYQCRWSEKGDWVWKPEGCKLVPFTKNAFCRSLQGHGLLLIGDSLSRQMFQSVFLMMGGDVRYFQEHGCTTHSRECRATICQDEGFNLESELHFVHCSQFNISDARLCRASWLERMEHFGTVVLSGGAHIQSVENFTINVQSTIRDLKSLASYHRIFWRTANWGLEEDDMKMMQPTPDPLPPTTRYHWDQIPVTNVLGTRLFQEAGYHTIDITPMTARRPDKHLDHLHYCIPGPVDTWIDLLFNYMLFLDDTTGVLPRPYAPIPDIWKLHAPGWRSYKERPRGYCDTPQPDPVKYNLENVLFQAKFEIVVHTKDNRMNLNYNLDEDEVKVMPGDVILVFLNDTVVQTVPAIQADDVQLNESIAIPTVPTRFSALLWSPLEEPLKFGTVCMGRRTLFEEKDICDVFDKIGLNVIEPRIGTVFQLSIYGLNLEWRIPPIPLLPDDVLTIEWPELADSVHPNPAYSQVYKVMDSSEYLAQWDRLKEHPRELEYRIVFRSKQGQVLAWGCGSLATVYTG